jgi:hypothetical protein
VSFVSDSEVLVMFVTPAGEGTATNILEWRIIISRRRVARWRKWPFRFYYANIQNKVRTYKSNLHSIPNIARSNPTGFMDVCSYVCNVSSGTRVCDGSIKSPEDIHSLCACVSVNERKLVPLYLN